MRTNCVRVVVGASAFLSLMPLLCLGQAFVVRQGDMEVGALTVGVSGAVYAGEETDPAVAQEQKVLGIQRKLVQKKRDAIEAKVLVLPEVAEALGAARDAAIAYYVALAENQAYGALRDEKERLSQERRNLWAAGGGMDKAKRLAKQKDLAGQIESVSKKIVEFPDTLPVFRGLKQRKTQAISAFLDLYQARLDEHPEWETVREQLDELSEWSRDLGEQRQMRVKLKRGK